METVIFIGIQATGKSTFFKERFFRSHIRINLDMLKTRRKEALLVEACLAMPHPFVVDNTNPTREDRKRYIQRAREGRFTVVGYYFSSIIQEALARNNLRLGRERIPEAGIRGTFSKLQLPEYTEGFDKLYHVTIDGDGGFLVKNWKASDEV